MSDSTGMVELWWDQYEPFERDSNEIDSIESVFETSGSMFMRSPCMTSSTCATYSKESPIHSKRTNSAPQSPENLDQLLEFLEDETFDDSPVALNEQRELTPKIIKKKLTRSSSCSSLPDKLVIGEIAPSTRSKDTGQMKQKPIKLANSSQMIKKLDIENVKERFKCSICLDVYKKPVSLPCSHTFCRSCLIEASEAYSSLGSCPLCRSTKHISLNPSFNAEKKVLGTFLENLMPVRSNNHRSPKKEKSSLKRCKNDMEEKCLFEPFLKTEEDIRKAIDYRRRYQCWRKKYFHGARGEFNSVMENIQMKPTSPKVVEPTPFFDDKSIVHRHEDIDITKFFEDFDFGNLTTDGYISKCYTGTDSLMGELKSSDVSKPNPATFIRNESLPPSHARSDTIKSSLVYNGQQVFSCPNDCGFILLQNSGSAFCNDSNYKAIMYHVNELYGDCPKASVLCPFNAVGCTDVLMRKDLQYHITCPVSVQLHINLLQKFQRTSRTERRGENVLGSIIGVEQEHNNLSQPISSASVFSASSNTLDFVEKVGATNCSSDMSISCPSWKKLTPEATIPNARYDHGAAVHNNRMFVLGGVEGNKRENDLHILEFPAVYSEHSAQKKETLIWKSPIVSGTKPMSGFLHKAVVIKDCLFAIGGSKEGKYLSDIKVMKLDGKFVEKSSTPSYHWESPTIKGDFPSIRYWYSCSACDEDNRVYIFGGYSGMGGTSGRVNDLYILDVSDVVNESNPSQWSVEWKLIKTDGTPPSVRSSHCSAIIKSRSHTMLAVFGGYDGKGRKNDFHVLNISNSPKSKKKHSWTQPKVYGTPPSVRYNHACTVVNQNQLCIFGGNSGSLKNDIYMLDMSNPDFLFWSQLKTTGQAPCVRYWHSIVNLRGNCIIFGGYSGSKSENDCYVLDLETFRRSPLLFQDVRGFSTSTNRKSRVKNTTINRKKRMNEASDSFSYRKTSPSTLSNESMKRQKIVPKLV